MKRVDIIKACSNSLNIYSFTAEALERLIEAVKKEQSCPSCEALARTVMLYQTSHDATPPQRKPLTDEEIEFIYADTGYNDIQMFARAIEAAHGIKGEA